MSQTLTLHKGQVLAARYEIKSLIAEEVLSTDYQAFDTDEGKNVVVKVVQAELMQNETTRKAFIKEAHLSTELSHPNIANVLDVQQEDDLCFLVMENIEGKSLRQLMEQRKRLEKPFSMNEIVELLKPICDALSYANKTTLHWDIKPENIYLTKQGEYKLKDFGLSRIMSARQRAMIGISMGTAYYIAPELLKGQSEVDIRADQYALAVLAYELISGEVPAGVIKPLHELNKNINKGFSLAVQKGLATKAEDRFQSLAAFLRGLQGKYSASALFSLRNLTVVTGLAFVFFGLTIFMDEHSQPSDVPVVAKVEEASAEKDYSKAEMLIDEIKSYKDQLNESRKKLQHSIETSADSANVASLQSWQALTDASLFSNEKLLQIEEQYKNTEILLQQKAYQQALPQLAKIKQNYQQLLTAFQQAKEVYPVRQKITMLQDKWLKIKRQNGLGDNALILAAKSLMKQAENSQQMGDYEQAIAYYRQVEPNYNKTSRKVKTLLAAQSDAVLAHKRWQDKQKYQQFESTKQQLSAETNSLKAKQAQQQGRLLDATQYWQQAQQDWQAAEDVTDLRIAELEQNQDLLRAEQELESQKLEQAKLAELKLEEDKKRLETEQIRQVHATLDAQNKQTHQAMLLSLVGEMITIPAGEFQMGCVSGLSCKEDQLPVHKVYVPSFKISQTEVTWAQYKQCVDDGDCLNNSDTSEVNWNQDDYPVVNVSWFDVQTYIKWLNQKTGEQFRLPSEAEWEYAARAGSTTRYSWGDTIGEANANCYQAMCGESYRYTAPVKAFPANAFGLYGVHGNAWEWVSDCWISDYKNSSNNAVANSQGDCSKRVLRGGGWNYGDAYLGSAIRSWYAASSRHNSHGFRLVKN